MNGYSCPLAFAAVAAFSFFVSGCDEVQTDNRVTLFKLPVIKPPLDGDTSAVRLSSDGMAMVSTHLLFRRFTFDDTINLEQRSLTDSFPKQDYTQRYQAIRQLRNQDSLTTGGLELVCDTATYFPYERLHLKCKYFARPVYIVNETGRTKLLYGFNSELEAYQEAKDTTGQWRPIEEQELLMDSFPFILKIFPHEYFAFLVPIYTGNFYTQIRVRLYNDDNVVVSRPYWGRINLSQFTRRRTRSLLDPYRDWDDSNFEQKRQRWIQQRRL